MDHSVRMLRSSIEQSYKKCEGHRTSGSRPQVDREPGRADDLRDGLFLGRFCGGVPSGDTVHRRRDHRSDLAMVGGMNFSRGPLERRRCGDVFGSVREWAERIGRKHERGNHCHFSSGRSVRGSILCLENLPKERGIVCRDGEANPGASGIRKSFQCHYGCGSGGHSPHKRNWLQ